ncbi:Splicing factor 3B subunit 4 [Smittium culicis]|uniref:Splicing factor 3B subunit 4 n=1 Tax=Smittium culicis TaxID=133412 RepID=A0A1R1X528_9FUNG|nr:Splicing factor 3B subunit 4 [Smittium culicis]
MSIQTERNQEATVYIGNLDERVTSQLIWELMVQAGPVVNVHLPKDRVTQMTQGYGFCEFQTEEDASYAVNIMNMVKLYGKPIRVNKALADKKPVDIGANLFISNLDPDIDEKALFDTFISFGTIVLTPKIVRDAETGISKGYAFVCFDSFEASDSAISSMDGQYLATKKISVDYAIKKDGKGEKHGSAAERLLAAQAKKNQPISNIAPIPPQAIATAPASVHGYQNFQPQQFPPYQQQQQYPPQPTVPYGMNPIMGQQNMQPHANMYPQYQQQQQQHMYYPNQ